MAQGPDADWAPMFFSNQKQRMDRIVESAAPSTENTIGCAWPLAPARARTVMVVPKSRPKATIYDGAIYDGANGPAAFFQASMPPWMWQAVAVPEYFAGFTA